MFLGFQLNLICEVYFESSLKWSFITQNITANPQSVVICGQQTLMVTVYKTVELVRSKLSI